MPDNQNTEVFLKMNPPDLLANTGKNRSQHTGWWKGVHQAATGGVYGWKCAV
jgi:hypothetical protein